MVDQCEESWMDLSYSLCPTMGFFLCTTDCINYLLFRKLLSTSSALLVILIKLQILVKTTASGFRGGNFFNKIGGTEHSSIKTCLLHDSKKFSFVYFSVSISVSFVNHFLRRGLLYSVIYSNFVLCCSRGLID